MPTVVNRALVEENPLHKTSVFGQAPGGHGNVPDQDGPVESEGLDLAGLQEVGVMVKLWGFVCLCSPLLLHHLRSLFAVSRNLPFPKPYKYASPRITMLFSIATNPIA